MNGFRGGRFQPGSARVSSSAPHPTGGLRGRPATGRRGEDAAVRQLEADGYAIRDRNWRCRLGELDIVAEHEGTIVFVEVRTRRANSRYGTAAESVDERKQRRVRAVAGAYIARHGLAGRPVRFDVMTCTVEPPDGRLRLQHYEGAF